MKMNNDIILENCQLEWQAARGVLYVHNKDTGATVLRICRLPVTFHEDALKHGMIDVTNGYGASLPDIEYYRKENEI
jgi:hypothetical protein